MYNNCLCTAPPVLIAAVNFLHIEKMWAGLGHETTGLKTGPNPAYQQEFDLAFKSITVLVPV